MKVVITGAAGFIGSHLAKKLLNKGYYVVGVDSLTDDTPLDIKQYRLKELGVFEKFEFIKLDILNDGVFTLLKDKKCDYFVHLAAKDIYYHKENPHTAYYEFFKVNTLGSIKMYELASIMGAKKFITTSTFSVYGNTKKQKLTERKILPNPISPHGASKMAMETALKYLYNHYKMPCIIMRLSSVYGPNMPTHTLIYNAIAAALTDGKLKTHVDISNQSRDFIYIDDVINIMITAFSKRLLFQIVNVASGVNTKLTQVIDMVNKVSLDYGGKGLLYIGSEDRHDIKKVIVKDVMADISKAKKLFKYEPQISFYEGIKRTFEWYSKNPALCEFKYYS